MFIIIFNSDLKAKRDEYIRIISKLNIVDGWFQYQQVLQCSVLWLVHIGSFVYLACAFSGQDKL